MKTDKHLDNEKRRLIRSSLSFLMSIFRFGLIVGISYVILGPILGIVINSFFSDADQYNPVVLLIPQQPTLEKYKLAMTILNYWSVMRNTLIYVISLSLIQIGVCSMVGYGFARFQFPFKKILFACVIIIIIIPAHSIMLPLFTTFRGFGLLKTITPMYIMTMFGVGLRSGLYIYIFNQFFRGLPKEIEEAAFVDGANTMYTYMRVMIPNAMPAIITVTIFSLVWQYNDLFYGNIFQIPNDWSIARKLNTLLGTLGPIYRVTDPSLAQLYVYAGIVLMILPMIIIYIFLQRRFIEGVERSGIVG